MADDRYVPFGCEDCVRLAPYRRRCPACATHDEPEPNLSGKSDAQLAQMHADLQAAEDRYRDLAQQYGEMRLQVWRERGRRINEALSDPQTGQQEGASEPPPDTSWARTIDVRCQEDRPHWHGLSRCTAQTRARNPAPAAAGHKAPSEAADGI